MSSSSGVRGSKALSDAMQVALFPWQLDVWQRPERFQVVTAGRRSGKSELMFKWVTMETLRHPSATTGWIVGPSLTHLREIIWERYVMWLQSQTVKVLVDKNETTMTVMLPGGKRVTLKGLEHPDKLLGKGLACLGMTEAAICPGEAWEKVLRPMLSDTMGRAMFESTPRGRNWFYRLARLGGLPEPGSASVKHPEWCFSRIKTEDVTDAQGEHIVPLEEIESYMTGINAMDPDTFAQEWRAEFLGYTGLLIPEFFDRAYPVGNTLSFEQWQQIKPRCNIVRGMDWGIGSQTVVLWAGIDPFGRVIFFHEYATSGKSLRDIALDVKSQDPEGQVHYTIGDRMMWKREYDGNTIAQQLADKGMPMVPSDSRFEDSIAKMRSMCQADIGTGIDPLGSMPKLMIVERSCPVLRAQLARTEVQYPDRTGSEVIGKQACDALDAARYVIMSTMRGREHRPPEDLMRPFPPPRIKRGTYGRKAVHWSGIPFSTMGRA